MNYTLKYSRKLLDFCVEVNFKLHHLKCSIFKNSITCCGRHISAQGVRFDPRQILGPENMEIPTMASEPLQFTSAMQWLGTSTAEFSIIIEPLLHTLESAYDKAGNRTKRALKSLSFTSVGWVQYKLVLSIRERSIV